MKQVSQEKSCHMCTHEFWFTCCINLGCYAMLVTCFFLTSAHIYPQVLFTAPLPPQVNRSSKSRAKRSDSERQRLMSRCQSLKESGAQAIAEKVDSIIISKWIPEISWKIEYLSFKNQSEINPSIPRLLFELYNSETKRPKSFPELF